jgi:hypothetical protein
MATIDGRNLQEDALFIGWAWNVIKDKLAVSPGENGGW